MTSLFLGRLLEPSRFARHRQLYTFRRWKSQWAQRRDAVKHRPPRNLPSSGSVDNGIGTSGTEEEIEPGQHVIKICKEHRIWLPGYGVLKPLRMKDLRLSDNMCRLGILISERHCIDPTSMKYLDRFEHPFAKSILDRYIAKNHEPLWYKVLSFPVAAPFPCRIADRRIRHAFRDALAAYGYDREGRKIKTDDDDHSIIADMFGTIKISCKDPKAACNAKFPDLLAQAKKIVAGIERMLARDKRGRHIGNFGR
ncbi:hypothetical protein F4804DRAFT_328205 [Jackrogersella minutella]|nr:hypothetical protein F4804DRAFT_328205 [Jackrogersella minutella]